MSGLVNLSEKSYILTENIIDNTKNSSIDNTNNRDILDEIVDEIVIEFVQNRAQLINDAELGVIPKSNLIAEIANYIDSKKLKLKDGTREELIKKILDYIFGYGIIQELIDDDFVSDIKIIGTQFIRKKVLGKRVSTELRFASLKSLLTYCRCLSINNGGNLSELTAIQKLTDVTSSSKFILRINITIPPAAKVPTIQIRKLPKKKVPLSELVSKYEMLSSEMSDYYINAIQQGWNIICCGKGGSGKTTLTNAGIEYIPHDESVLIMQESDELFTDHPETLVELVKYKSGENDMEYSLRDYTINGLLQDIDRMIIGEIKGPEAMDFFNAVYTGHVGCTCLHAPSAEKAILKAIHFMKYSGTDLPMETLMEMLDEIDLIIYMKNYKVLEMVEVKGFNTETKRMNYNPVFAYKDGNFTKIGNSCDKKNNIKMGDMSC